MTTFAGDAGWRSDLAVAVTVVQRHSASAEERWHLVILHRLLMFECQDKERLIPKFERSGDNRIPSGCQIFLHHGPQEWVLAGGDVQGVLPVHSVHRGKHGCI